MFDPASMNVFAETNYRGQRRRFGIKLDDRRRHMYLVGKTGMGKSTVMERMIVNDMEAGHGIALVDPHGDLVEKMLEYVPNSRINDIVYINPSDYEYPIGFNVLEAVDATQRHLVASGLMGVFTKIWEGVWSARMEYILNNTILALLEYPGSTMLGIARMLVDPRYRTRVLTKVTDPIVKGFWVDEFANYNDKFRNEAVAPIQNKVGQFLSSAIIRNIVGQPKSTIDLRSIMDSKKIMLLNLAKGRIGEDNSSLLGAMMITRLQLAAMSRVDTPEPQRNDFFLYVDEFQNFATESFAGILSEARKYRLDLIIAHQYIEQLSEEVAPAVFGNVGTIMAFRVGGEDAEFLEKEFEPTFMQTDLVNLPKYEVYLKLMIDGVASEPFSATTLPPFELQPTNNREKVIAASRERYAQKRTEVEEKILRWSGVEEVYRASAEEENNAVQQEESIYRPEGKKRRPPKDLFQRESVIVEPIVAEQQQPTIRLADLAQRPSQNFQGNGRNIPSGPERRPMPTQRPNYPRPNQSAYGNERRATTQRPPQPFRQVVPPVAKIEEPVKPPSADLEKPKPEKRLSFGQTVKF
ncbi:MAG: type IV secretion system DNA-binding domain-containing protein [Patescibacteria group bacterium]